MRVAASNVASSRGRRGGVDGSGRDRPALCVAGFDGACGGTAKAPGGNPCASPDCDENASLAARFFGIFATQPIKMSICQSADPTKTTYKGIR